MLVKNITFLQRQQINQLDEMKNAVISYNKKFEIWIAEEVNRARNWVVSNEIKSMISVVKAEGSK